VLNPGGRTVDARREVLAASTRSDQCMSVGAASLRPPACRRTAGTAWRGSRVERASEQRRLSGGRSRTQMAPDDGTG
jgi:hypothetical protein